MAVPKQLVRTQSILFDVFGDDVIPREGRVWVGSLIKLLGELGYSEQAIRLALSRMCQKGWLRRERIGKKSYYYLTEQSMEILREGEKRIFPFFRRSRIWDGTWHLVSYSVPEDRRRVREKLRKELTWLGYGMLSHGTWISPFDHAQELERVIKSLHIKELIEHFAARHLGYKTDEQLVEKCWNLQDINNKYKDFLSDFEPKFKILQEEMARGSLPTARCFVERVSVVHAYRKVIFFDPGLPPNLLPNHWLGEKSAEIFEAMYILLHEGANNFVDSVYEPK